MKRRILSLLLAICMAATLLPMTALAADEGETQEGQIVKISSDEELVAAIEGQADGQTWEFTKEGTYDVFNSGNYTTDNASLPATDKQIGGYVVGDKEYIFPIHVDNITIKKADNVAGEVIVTSHAVAGESFGGMGNYQNFITITGNNVKVDGISIKAPVNEYYGECNKIIEVYGANAKLSNLNLLRTGDTLGSGNIIFNSENIGSATVENVYMYGWISAGYAKAGTLTVTGFTSDFTNNPYAGFKDETYGYGWNPGVHTKPDQATVTVEGMVIKVDNAINLTEQVFNANMKDNTTVQLTGENATYEVDKMLDIAADGVTLDLGGNTLTASENFTGSFDNDKHLVNVMGDNVTIKNGTLKTTDSNKHVLNVYQTTGTTIEDLTLDHTNGFKGAPLIINGSDVTAKGDLNLIAGRTSWYGINVDDHGTSGSAKLTFEDDVNLTCKDADGNDKTAIYVEFGTDAETAVVDPENAGLEMNGNMSVPAAPVSTVTTYAVTIEKVDNGKVTTSTTRASKGSTVTLTVKPDEGYALDQLTVTDANGNAVSVTKSSDTKYTFKMPAAKVTVKATFEKAEVVSSLPFTDVDVDDWFYEAVEYVYENDMMNGVSDTKFGPDAQLTRGMIVTILYRLENEPAVSGSDFSDVVADQYYADPVAWAAKNGIVTGYPDGTFGPNKSITREQLAAILYRYASYKGYDVSKSADLSAYTDADSVSAYAKDAMAWANAEGIITGVTSTTLNPTGTATRAQVAAILARFVANVG